MLFGRHEPPLLESPRNPFGDEGTATLSVGTVEFAFDLINLEGGLDWSQAFVPPLRLVTGQEVVFEVNCAAAGRAGANACSTSAVINGRLVDI